LPAIDSYIPNKSELLFESESGERTASALIEFGGWDHRGKTLTPIKVIELSKMPGSPVLQWVMDSFAAGAEAGRLNSDCYVEQLFASSEDVRHFRGMLRDAGRELWVNDRHFNAVRKFGIAEIDCSTYSLISGFFDVQD
jgi:hypothetical protein